MVRSTTGEEEKEYSKCKVFGSGLREKERERVKMLTCERGYVPFIVQLGACEDVLTFMAVNGQLI